ncbi:MAG: protein kinase [Planctomycetes bacterium]|nr:protein kinase [Planctomycetota bacterium]
MSGSSSSFEDLLAAALMEIEAEGLVALEGLCASHPGHADLLRARVAALLAAGILVPGIEASGVRGTTLVGPYPILRRLGRGGMGVVLLAEHPQLGRQVAIKCFRSTVQADPRGAARFLREARAMAQLSHPGIVPVHDIGEADGTAYFVMEYVDGPTVSEALTRTRERGGSLADGNRFASDDCGVAPDLVPMDWCERPFDAAAQIVARVADALAHAHARGILHRDVKPQNVIVGRDGRIRLFDFGLARIDDQEGMTTTHEFLGTPHYVAPELVEHGSRAVDPRTDVYGLGAVLYELLTLRPPFDGPSTEDVLRRVLVHDLERPRSRDATIPRALEAVCLRALEREPEDRYAGPADLGQDLRRFLLGDTVRAVSPGRLRRGRRWLARHRALGGALLGVFVLGLTVAGMLARRALESHREHAQRVAVLLDSASSALAAADAESRAADWPNPRLRDQLALAERELARTAEEQIVAPLSDEHAGRLAELRTRLLEWQRDDRFRSAMDAAAVHNVHGSLTAQRRRSLRAHLEAFREFGCDLSGEVSAETISRACGTIRSSRVQAHLISALSVMRVHALELGENRTAELCEALLGACCEEARRPLYTTAFRHGDPRVRTLLEDLAPRIDDPIEGISIANAMDQHGLAGHAEQLVARLLIEHPDCPELLAHHAQRAVQAGLDWPVVLERLRAAVAANPSKATARVLLVKHVVQNRADEADAVLRKAIEDFPDNAALWYWDAARRIQLGDRAGAIALLERLLLAVPGQAAAAVTLAGMVDDPERRRAVLEQCLLHDPDFHEARLMLAELRSGSLAWDELEGMLRPVLGAGPTWREPRAHELLAARAMREARWSEATIHLRVLVECGRHERLGDWLDVWRRAGGGRDVTAMALESLVIGVGSAEALETCRSLARDALLAEGSSAVDATLDALLEGETDTGQLNAWPELVAARALARGEHALAANATAAAADAAPPSPASALRFICTWLAAASAGVESERWRFAAARLLAGEIARIRTDHESGRLSQTAAFLELQLLQARQPLRDRIGELQRRASDGAALSPSEAELARVCGELIALRNALRPR